MIDGALIAAAAALGFVSAPHCTAMCSAPCSALSARCGARPAANLAAFLGGRLFGYALAGAAVAAGVGAFAALGQSAPLLRPLWSAVQLAALGLGLWLLVTGAMPAWLGNERVATRGSANISVAPSGLGLPCGQGNLGRPGVSSGALRAGAAGTLWFALPCGALHAALIVAALANSPWHGAAAMSAFALTSSLGLAVFPALWSRRTSRLVSGAWVVRASGLALVSASIWALTHGVWQRVTAWCA